MHEHFCILPTSECNQGSQRAVLVAFCLQRAALPLYLVAECHSQLIHCSGCRDDTYLDSRSPFPPRRTGGVVLPCKVGVRSSVDKAPRCTSLAALRNGWKPRVGSKRTSLPWPMELLSPRLHSAHTRSDLHFWERKKKGHCSTAHACMHSGP